MSRGWLPLHCTSADCNWSPQKYQASGLSTHYFLCLQISHNSCVMQQTPKMAFTLTSLCLSKVVETQTQPIYSLPIMFIRNFRLHIKTNQKFSFQSFWICQFTWGCKWIQYCLLQCASNRPLISSEKCISATHLNTALAIMIDYYQVQWPSALNDSKSSDGQVEWSINQNKVLIQEHWCEPKTWAEIITTLKSAVWGIVWDFMDSYNTLFKISM